MLKVEVASLKPSFVFMGEPIYEPHFSWSACDNCGDTLGGNRYDMRYRETLHGPICEAEICESCVEDLCS